MKLQKQYQIGLFKTFAVLSLPFILTLYLLMNYLTKDEVKELLDYQTEKIVNLIQEGKQLSSIPPTIIINTIKESQPSVSFEKTYVYDELANETEEYYELKSVRLINGSLHEIIVRSTAVERLDLFLSIFISTLAILVILGFLFFQLNTQLFRRLLTPFQNTLTSLRNFSIHEAQAIEYRASNIDEFDDLAKAAFSLSTKAIKDYETLKQFAENASHEMQTPLAIIKNKIEQIINLPSLSANLSHELIGIGHAADRLTNLNKGLLLLTKIDNHQFSKVELINFGELVHCELDFIHNLGESSIEVIENEQFQQLMNPHLAELLVRNLMKNMVIHSNNQADRKIYIDSTTISFANHGTAPLAGEEQLFARFHKETSDNNSLGLGLAIAKAICGQGNLRLDYEFNTNRHQFRVSKLSSDEQAV